VFVTLTAAPPLLVTLVTLTVSLLVTPCLLTLPPPVPACLYAPAPKSIITWSGVFGTTSTTIARHSHSHVCDSCDLSHLLAVCRPTPGTHLSLNLMFLHCDCLHCHCCDCRVTLTASAAPALTNARIDKLIAVFSSSHSGDHFWCLALLLTPPPREVIPLHSFHIYGTSNKFHWNLLEFIGIYWKFPLEFLGIPGCAVMIDSRIYITVY